MGPHGVLLVFAANVINIGANLSAMAEALKLLTGGPSPIYVVAVRPDLRDSNRISRLRPLREGLEMDHPQPVRLRHFDVRGKCALDGGVKGIVDPTHRGEQSISDHASGHLRHYHSPYCSSGRLPRRLRKKNSSRPTDH